MHAYDLIVIGGGVSGLVLASRAAALGQSTLLLERETRLGGCLQTWQATPDFWLELGAHTAYNSYKALLEALAEKGGLERLLPREKLGYRFLDRDRLQSPLARLGWLELLAHLPRHFRQSQAGRGLAEHYGALFGPRNYARMLAPAFAAVLSQPADAFPAEWLFRRKARMRGAPRKYSWPGGLQGLAETLADRAAFSVGTGMAVESVLREGAGYVLQAGGETHICRKLAVATPPDTAARLLTGTHPEAAVHLSEIPMAEIGSVAVVVGGKTRLPPLAGLIGVDDDFYSVVTRDPVPHAGLRGFTFHFRPGGLDDEGRLARIEAVLGVGRDAWVAHKAVVNRLPALSVYHVGLARELDRYLAGRPLALAGNYFQGLSIGDCADRAAREALRLFGDEPGD